MAEHHGTGTGDDPAISGMAMYLTSKPPYQVRNKDHPDIVKLKSMLDYAAELEHALMCSYLYAAYSVKTRWEEFAYIKKKDDSNTWLPNGRAAIQYELMRECRREIIAVAREEMQHLHLVSIIARSFGFDSPNFALSSNDDTPTFPMSFEKWQPLGPETKSIKFDISSLTRKQVLKFILLESNEEIFTKVNEESLLSEDDNTLSIMQGLFDEMNEANLRLQGYLALDEIDETDSSVKKFKDVMKNTPVQFGNTKMAPSKVTEADLEDQVKLCLDCTFASTGYAINVNKLENTDIAPFESIGVFYNQLKALIEKIFEEDKNREDKLINYDGNAQDVFNTDTFKWLLPQQRQGTHLGEEFQGSPMTESTMVHIIDQIIEQGEGSADFFVFLTSIIEADWTMEKVQEFAVYSNLRSDVKPTGGVSETAKKMNENWYSHLGRFSRVFASLQHEEKVCREEGFIFEPARTARITAMDMPDELKGPFVTEVFNILFLVMRVLLRRLYFVYPEREVASQAAVSSVSLWPMMSMVIRPMLEIISFIDHDPNRLFSVPAKDFDGAKYAGEIELLTTIGLEETAEKCIGKQDEINEALKFILTGDKGLEKWAKDMKDWLVKDGGSISWEGSSSGGSDICEPTEIARGMLFRRFENLHTSIRELIQQKDFRAEGGKSETPANDASLDEESTYEFSENATFSEFKFKPDNRAQPVMKGTIYETGQKLMRLRFNGWGQLLLATDPEATTDETGYSGNLRSYYGETPFDRSLLFDSKPFIPHGESLNSVKRNHIQRKLSTTEKFTEEPKIKFVEAHILTLSAAWNGVVSKAMEYSTSPLLLQPEGSITKLNLPDGLCLALPGQQEGDISGRSCYMVGENLLVWEQREPLDPFNFTITNGNNKFSRSTKGNTRFVDFNPQQRAVCGRGSVKKIPKYPRFLDTECVPGWAQDIHYNWLYPKDGSNFSKRTASLKQLVKESLDTSDATKVVEYSTRRSFQLKNDDTLGIFMNYFHTISGDTEGSLKDVLSSLNYTGKEELPWLANYIIGSYDTDAGGMFQMLGEVYIPVKDSDPQEIGTQKRKFADMESSKKSEDYTEATTAT